LKTIVKDLQTGKTVNIDVSKMKGQGTICYGEHVYTTYIDEATGKRYEEYYKERKTKFDRFI